MQGVETEVLVGTDICDGFGTSRMVSWCGAILQDSHRAVRAMGFLPEEGHGVYIARYTMFINSLATKVFALHAYYHILRSSLGGPMEALLIDMVCMLYNGLSKLMGSLYLIWKLC